MRLTYDPKRNIGYIRLHEKTAQVETLRISDEMNVDIAPDGTVYGIELLNANAQLQPEDDGNLVVVDESVGRAAAVPLAVREAPAKYGSSPRRPTRRRGA